MFVQLGSSVHGESQCYQSNLSVYVISVSLFVVLCFYVCCSALYEGCSWYCTYQFVHLFDDGIISFVCLLSCLVCMWLVFELSECLLKNYLRTVLV